MSYYDPWYDSVWRMLLLLIGGVCALLALVFTLVIVTSRPVGRVTCANWGRNTGIPTKFVTLSFWDTGTCLAQTSDGRWVKNTQLRELIGGK